MLKRLTIFIAAIGFVLSAGVANAASSCKGLSNNRCDGSCYWVKSYKTKKGTNVKAHCRAKPNGGATTSTTTKKKKKKSTAASTTSASDTARSTSKNKKKVKKKKKTKKKKKQPSS